MNLPEIKPEWRTTTVTELCRSMREAQDYSALPILADALQDAGCPEDSDVLDRCRLGSVSYVDDSVFVACVMCDEARSAVNDIASVLADVGSPHSYGWGDDDERVGDPLTVEEVVQTMHESLHSRMGGYIQMGQNESYKGMDWNEDSAFWKAYRLLTGDNAQGTYGPGCIFSCSC